MSSGDRILSESGADDTHLGVRPLFYDALSGEFKPKTDPNKQAHTLGRLAYASVMKGEISRNVFVGALGRFPLNAHRYEPSWANITSTALRDAGSMSFINGLQLHPNLDEAEEGLSVYDVPLGSGQRGIQIAGSIDKGFSLKLGRPLNEAKRVLTDQAQQFFDYVYEVSGGTAQVVTNEDFNNIWTGGGISWGGLVRRINNEPEIPLAIQEAEDGGVTLVGDLDVAIQYLAENTKGNPPAYLSILEMISHERKTKKIRR